MYSWEQQRRRILKEAEGVGLRTEPGRQDDDDIEWELDRMDGKNPLQEARPAERPLYPRYKPADPAMVARIYRQMGRPYDASLIPEEEKYYIGGWDNGDDDDNAAPQAKPAQNPFTP